MVRRTTSLMTALGIALVVMVVVILLSFVGGLRQSLELAGEPGHWIVLSRGTVSEGESYIPREEADVLRTRPEIATDASGAALFSPEMVVPFNAAIKRPAVQFRPASLRGVSRDRISDASRTQAGGGSMAGAWPRRDGDWTEASGAISRAGRGHDVQVRAAHVDDRRSVLRSRQRARIGILDRHRRAAAGCAVREWLFVISRRAEAGDRGDFSKRAHRRCATDCRCDQRAGFFRGAGQGRGSAARAGADRRPDRRHGRGVRWHEYDVCGGCSPHARE